MILEYLAVGPLGANCYLLGDRPGGTGVVVDPGGEVDRILALVLRHRLSLQYIVNTHGHVDHIGGNGRLQEATGAKIAVHAADAPLLVDPAGNLSLWLGPQLRVEGPPADLLLRQGDELTCGELKLRVLHTPGHTPGSICLLAPGGVLLTGDTLFAGSVGRTDFPGGDLATLLSSIEQQLLTLPDETRVYPGHGEPTSVGEERRGNPFLSARPGRSI